MRRVTHLIVIAFAGLDALSASSAHASPLRSYFSLALSPSGDRVAAVEKADEPDSSSPTRGEIVVRSVADGRILTHLDPCATCAYADLTFGADNRLAFVAHDAKSGASKLMVATGGSTRTLATVEGLAGRPRWSPDGSQIAMLVTIGAHKDIGATQAGPRAVGEIGAITDEQRIAIVPAFGGTLRLISRQDRFIYEYDWTPDNKGFVATSAQGNGDANWWVATIDAIDADTGVTRTIAAPRMQANFPRVSPDGKTVAFIGGLMSDFGSVGGDAWEVPFTGGVPVQLLPQTKMTTLSLSWTKQGLRPVTLAGNLMRITQIVAGRAGGPTEAVEWERPASFAAGDGRVAFSADGRTVATVLQDFDHGPAIYAGAANSPVQITHDNDLYPASVSARSLTWQSGGNVVQGWLLAPVGSQANEAKAPMVVIAHGGPASAATPFFQWQGTFEILLRAGYWLFFPNPRGSFGQGEAFTQANKRDFGGGDLKDILAGIDAAEQQAPIDDRRIGLIGGSYGGFMGMWANTQTKRFKAIISSAGVSDWVSYYGTNGINEWMIPYFGKSMYDDPSAYRAVSPIDFIKEAHTPTLITAGERDIEVPPTQSLEYFNALKAMNVPVSLVIYPDEGHAIRAPDHVADQQRRTIGWLDRYLQATASP